MWKDAESPSGAADGAAREPASPRPRRAGRGRFERGASVPPRLRAGPVVGAQKEHRAQHTLIGRSTSRRSAGDDRVWEK